MLVSTNNSHFRVVKPSVDVTIIQDFVDEVDESFTLELTLEYVPFDVPLDTYSVTIVDSGEMATYLCTCIQ